MSFFLCLQHPRERKPRPKTRAQRKVWSRQHCDTRCVVTLRQVRRHATSKVGHKLETIVRACSISGIPSAMFIKGPPLSLEHVHDREHAILITRACLYSLCKIRRRRKKMASLVNTLLAVSLPGFIANPSLLPHFLLGITENFLFWGGVTS